MDTQDTHHDPRAGRIFGGIAIILLGLALLADRLDVDDLHFPGSYWPLLLIALGAVKLFGWHEDGRDRSRRGGAWLVYVGCWGAVNEFHLFGLDYQSSWPLLIVGAGIITIWRALEPGPCQRHGASEIR